MIKPVTTFAVLFMLLAQATTSFGAQEKDKAGPDEEKNKIVAIAEKIEGMKAVDGYFPFYWDAKTGSVLMEIKDWDREFLYVHSLATGLGSNPVGLDRGQLGYEKVVHFRRVGPKVMLSLIHISEPTRP